MKRIFGIVVFIGASTLSNHANAAVAGVQTLICNACTTLQMQGKVRSWALGQPAGTRKTIYVLNPSANVTTKQLVYTDYDGGDARECERPTSSGPNRDCTRYVQIQAQPVEQAAVNYNEVMRAASVASPIKLPAPGAGGCACPGSPFTDMQNVNSQYAVSDYMKGQLAVRLQQITDAAYVLGVTQIQATFPVNYSDGGSALYAWDTATQRWIPVPGSYKDKNGNSIPQNLQQITGGNPNVTIYYGLAGGSPQDFSNWADQLEGVGAVVVGSPSATTARLVCKSKYVENGVGVECHFE